MSELCRVIIISLLLIDVQRGVITSNSSSSVSIVSRDDNTAHEASSTDVRRRHPPRCRPPSSDALWLRLRYRADGAPLAVAATSDDDDEDAVEKDVEATTVTDRPGPAAENDVDRRRHPFRHGRGRRRSRTDRLARRRRRLKLTAVAASNSTSDELDTTRADAFRRRGRRLDARASRGRSEPSRRGRTAWQCGLEKFWKRTGSDVFPAYVQSGRCTTPTCMMGLYECRERRYAITVLRRRRGRCVPLPLTGAVNSTSSAAAEELWTPAHVSVVVACECSARRATGVFVHPATTPSSPPH